MKENIQRLINKYKRLPSFLQNIALRKLLRQGLDEISQFQNDDKKAKKEFIRQLFKTSKASVRVKNYIFFDSEYYDARDNSTKENIIDALDEKEQDKFLKTFDASDILDLWLNIKSEDTKKTMLPKIFEYIKNSNNYYDILSKVADIFSRDPQKTALKFYANEIYEIYLSYDFNEHKKTFEDANNRELPRRAVISDAMYAIWDGLSEKQKNDIAPRIIEEFENSKECFGPRNFEYLLKDFSPSIQIVYYDQIMNKVKKIAEGFGFFSHYFGTIWANFHPEVQAEKFSEIRDFGAKKDFGILQHIWKNTDVRIQRQKYYSVLTDELKTNHNEQYWNLYEVTKGKLQSEILNKYLINSLYLSPNVPDDDLKKALVRTSREVYDRNFQYLFRKTKGNIAYASTLLINVPDDIKRKYSSDIGKYFALNLEAYLKSPYASTLISSGSFLDKESCEILIKNLIDFSKNNPNFLDETKAEVNLENSIANFFSNINEDTQKSIINDVLDEQNDTLFQKLFNELNLDSNDEKKELLKRYFEQKGFDKEKINRKINIYSNLYSKNIELSRTIDLDFLGDDIVEELLEEQLLRITHYKNAQKHLREHKDNKAFIKMFGMLVSTPENWTIIADKIFTNLQNKDNKFDILLNDIKDKDLTEDELKNLIEILSSDNYFELEKYEDVRDFQKNEGKKNKIITQILNEDYENVTDAIKNEHCSKIDLKRFALSEYLFNMSLDDLEHMIQNYYDGIKGLKEIPNNDSFNRELKMLKKYLEICKLIKTANSTEIDAIVSYVLNSEKHTERYLRMDIESRIINVFGTSIERDLYDPEEHKNEIAFYDSYNDNGKEKTISVYRMQDDFDALVRIEGAYADFSIPEDFREYFEIPNINYHGNCQSIIGNDLIAPAREQDVSIAVGYSKVYRNSLLLAGPIDLVSSVANKELAPVNYQINCQFLGTEENKNRTRHTHNENVMERLIVAPNGKVEKLKPSYILWFEEELNEKTPPNVENEKNKKWKIAKQAAAQLDLPIVIINREYYAQRETEKMHKLEEIIKGSKNLADAKKLPDIMEKLILTMENNSNSLRFSEKIKTKYFTFVDRERINKLIKSKIEELSKSDPELAYECLQKVLSRTEYEERMSESKDITDFYKNQNFEMNHIKENLEKYLDKSAGIEIKVSKKQRETFTRFIYHIASTEYYINQKQHSIEHIEKVMFFSQILAQNEGLTEEDTKILLAAAAFHDSSRNGNDYKGEHAKEGAKIAGEFFSNSYNPFNIKPEEISIIQVAIEYHEFNENPCGTLDVEKVKELCNKYNVQAANFNRTLKISELLKDADALDRTRFANRGGLDRKYLRSETAKSDSMVFFAQKVNDEYAKRVLVRNYRVDALKGKNVDILKQQRLNNPEFKETPLTVGEMLQLFDEMSTPRECSSIEERLESLFRNYEEFGIIAEDIHNAGRTIEQDRQRYNIEASRGIRETSPEDCVVTGEEGK